MGSPKGPLQYVVYHFSGHDFCHSAHSEGVCWVVGGPCDFSVSPNPFGLDFGTLDLGLTIVKTKCLLFIFIDNLRVNHMSNPGTVIIPLQDSIFSIFNLIIVSSSVQIDGFFGVFRLGLNFGLRFGAC